MEITPEKITSVEILQPIEKKVHEVLNLADLGSIPAVIIEDGLKVECLKDLVRKYMPKPERKNISILVTDIQSFVDYINEHKLTDTRMFAAITTAPYEYSCVIDFQGTKQEDTSWMTHSIKLKLHLTPEFMLWNEMNNQTFSQVVFAEFIEDNMSDISSPAGAELLETARNLIAKKSVDFRSQIRLDNGDVQLHYQEKTETQSGITGSIDIPELFTLKLAIFHGSAEVEIKARLRYRINEGVLTFSFKLIELLKIIRTNLLETSEKIENNTSVKIFYGSIG